MKTIDVIARIVIALGLGSLTPFVFIIGAEPFEVRGGKSFAEILSGSVVLALYLALCQFTVARMKAQPGGHAKWPVVVAMAAPVVAWAAYLSWMDGLGAAWNIGLPMLAAGAGGIGIGAVLAAKKKAAG